MRRPALPCPRAAVVASLLRGAIGALVLWAAPCRADRFMTYVVRPSDTPESIAAEYYGNRARAQFITEFNGLPRAVKLHPGQPLKIPTSYRYRLMPKDNLADLAQRFVGDRRRAPLLLQLSGLQKATTGSDIQVPFQFIHVSRPGETLTGIARAYYGDPGQARLLAQYNFRKNPNQPPAPGEKLVIPITHVWVRSVRLIEPHKTARKTPPPPAPAAGTPEPPLPVPIPVETADEAQRAEAELAEQVRSRLSDAERSYNEGNYTDVPAALVKLLTKDPSEAQLVDIYRLLAFAYVALGETELAVPAFREVLERQPDFQLDPIKTSPKIRAALDRARSGS